MFAAAGGAAGLLFVVLWASAFTVVGGVVPEWPPIWALAIRFALVAPLLFVVVLARGARLPATGDLPRVAAMGVFGSALYLAGAWSATALIPTGLVALVSATAPLFVALGERALTGRALPRGAWVGLALGWGGVALLGVGRGAGDGASALGVALALGGALAQSVGLLAISPTRGRLDPWAANALQTAAAAVTLLLLALAVETRLPGAPSAGLVVAMGYSMVVVGVGAYALLFTLLRRLAASTAAALQLLAPPLAAVFGWALFDERLAWTDVAGGVVTLAGLALLLHARR